MVSVQVRNKNAVEPAHACVVFTHLQLGALAAINHKQFFVHVYKLRRRIVQGCRHCRAAAEYGNVESGHLLYSYEFVSLKTQSPLRILFDELDAVCDIFGNNVVIIENGA